jgi:hypothetical protein
VKVLVKFLLLERQRIGLAALPALLTAIPVVGSAMRQMDSVTPAAGAYTTLANWAVSSLLRAKAARIDGDFLVDA